MKKRKNMKIKDFHKQMRELTNGKVQPPRNCKKCVIGNM